MPYLILAQSEVTACALGAWLELLGEPPLEGDVSRLDDARVLCSSDPESKPGGFVEGFRWLAGDLEQSVLSTRSGRLTVLVDSVKVSDLNAVGSPRGWDRLISLLVLAFPDIRFVFGISNGLAEAERTQWNARHGLVSLFSPIFSPLFDGTGLRAKVCKDTAAYQVPNGNGGMRKVAAWIPQRCEWALAVDDEAMYAYLHAYVAYRQGYRVFAVHSKELADHLLADKNSTASGWNLGVPHLSLEDYYLGFPDKETSVHLAHLQERTDYWKVLKSGPIRHFITSGHGRSQGEENVQANRDFRRNLRLNGRGGREVAKPVAGMFALWKELGMDRQLQYSASGRPLRGLAPGFEWPPEDRDGGSGEGGGHSAPGLLLLVAEILIRRAEARIDSVKTVKDAVCGAVLAKNALELLGPKTPTTAREALELKHRFEVMAECQFGGIQYNLEPKERFAEIRRDMKMLGRWYGVGGRDAAVLNGELTIVSRLMRTFRDFEEFDEEEKCRARMRSIQTRIWWKKSRSNPIAWIVLPIRVYTEFLIGSMTRFAGALVVWIAALTIAFSFLQDHARDLAREQTMQQTSATGTDAANSGMKLSGKIDADQAPGNVPWSGKLSGTIAPAEPDNYPLNSAISFFFGVEPLESPLRVSVLVSILAILSGFIHLGIFISQLYSIVARK